MPVPSNADADGEQSGGLRLDRWLVNARFFKTRALAARAAAGGHVRRNRERAGPGDKVRIGDDLEVVKGHERFVIAVRALPSRRGPASEAQACYLETEQSIEERKMAQARLLADRMAMPRTTGRPDRKTRRLLRDRHRSGT